MHRVTMLLFQRGARGYWCRRTIFRAVAIVMALCTEACQAPHADPARRDAAAIDAERPVMSLASRAAPAINSTPAPAQAPADMVWVPGGRFWMGCESCAMPDALPVHLVEVDGFWMDRTPVTNADFERFVTATGYVTVAERPLDPRHYPSVPEETLWPGATVFFAPTKPVPLDNALRWWRYVAGAHWKRPEGPASGIVNRRDHPVVHVAYEDVQAYAAWAGKRLPREAEFEFAARGGLDRARYAWGRELMPGGKPAANLWQGPFPALDVGDDGYTGTSPVAAFQSNGFGLYDMGGNVWQWCADWYRPDAYASRAGIISVNPSGPDRSFDPEEPGAEKRVLRGGSYLCTDQYCARYLVGSRGKSEITSGASNVGFRLVRSAG